MDVVELDSSNTRALDRIEWASCIREATPLPPPPKKNCSAEEGRRRKRRGSGRRRKRKRIRRDC
jgi:hypothetical protein